VAFAVGDKEIEGVKEGAAVVGDSEGRKVGIIDGRAVGTKVGCFVGEAVRLLTSQTKALILSQDTSSQLPIEIVWK
jgi:hypothetical protein